MDCEDVNYNVAPIEVVIEHELIKTSVVNKKKNLKATNKSNRRVRKSRDLLVDDFERLMNLFPFEHPASIHGIMINCVQNFNEAASMLQYITEFRDTPPNEESTSKEVKIQMPVDILPEKFKQMRISQYREDMIYGIQYHPYGIAQLVNELSNDTDDSSEEEDTQFDFVEMVPNIPDTENIDPNDTSEFIVIPPAYKFSEMTSTGDFDFLRIISDKNF